MSGAHRRLAWLAAAGLAWLALPGPAVAASADAASAATLLLEARQLIADGSGEARATLERVVALDPQGPLADDALVELARLEGLTIWTDELGAVDPAAARRADLALGRAERVSPDGDRLAEARLLRALLRLEPIAGHDPRAARTALRSVCADRGMHAAPWRDAARLALAWLDETAGALELAEGGYLQVVLDAPQASVERRAQAGLGRVLLRQGRPGRAAVALRRALELAAGEDPDELELRELAVKRALGLPPAASSAPSVLRAAVQIRAVAGLVALSGGGAAIGDRRDETVRIYSGDGLPTEVRSLTGLQRIGPDAFGRGVVAAAGTSLFRLATDGVWRPLVPLETFERPTAIAVGDDGRVWIVDRKGERLGTVPPGGAAITVVREFDDVRLAALGVAGPRAVVIGRRGGPLLRIDADGGEVRIGTSPGERPLALDVDASGRTVVLDGRTGAVELHEGSATPTALRLDPEAFARPVAVSFGPDGSLHLLDATAGLWGRWP